jgi:hypothetical protein
MGTHRERVCVYVCARAEEFFEDDVCASPPTLPPPQPTPCIPSPSSLALPLLSMNPTSIIGYEARVCISKPFKSKCRDSLSDTYVSARSLSLSLSQVDMVELKEGLLKFQFSPGIDICEVRVRIECVIESVRGREGGREREERVGVLARNHFPHARARTHSLTHAHALTQEDWDAFTLNMGLCDEHGGLSLVSSKRARTRLTNAKRARTRL